jgi:hypothetical protein
MIEFENPRNIGDSLLKVRYFFIVISQFDERSYRWESLRMEDEISMRQGIEIRLDEEEIRTSLN